jgi:hypothetical protein
MKKYLLTLIFGFLVLFTAAQVQTDSTYRLPAKEKLHYKIYYKLSKIWINAGVANLKTDTLTNDSTLLYRFTADGFTLNKYRWIYSLEDHYESLTDYNTLEPVRFEKENTEKGIWVHNIYNFFPDEHKIDMFMEASKKHPVKKTETFNGFITDALSAIYYIRTWDFNNLNEGDTLVFKTILDGKIFDQSLIYLGKDVLQTAGGKEVNTFKLGAIIENSTFFRGEDAVVVWITDNRQRWLAKAKAKIVVGSIIVYLDKQGLVSFGPK